MGVRFYTHDTRSDDHGNHVENRIVFGSFSSGNPGASNFNPTRDYNRLAHSEAHDEYFVTSPSASPSASPLINPEIITQVNAPISCHNCLSEGHYASSCTSKIRCRICYDYGHIARSCFNKRKKSLTYRKKTLPDEPLSIGRQRGAVVSSVIPQDPAATSDTPLPSPLMTHKYRGSQQSSREVKPKFIDSTQGEPKNIYKP